MQTGFLANRARACVTCAIFVIFVIFRTGGANPLFSWTECTFVIFAIFVKTPCFRQGAKTPFDKNPVCVFPRSGPKRPWQPQATGFYAFFSAQKSTKILGNQAKNSQKIRTSSTTTRDRNLQFRGAVSTGGSPLDFFCFFSSFYVQFSKTSPLKSGESSEKSSGENGVKSCHVCGCHGFFGPEKSKGFSLKRKNARKSKTARKKRSGKCKTESVGVGAFSPLPIPKESSKAIFRNNL